MRGHLSVVAATFLLKRIPAGCSSKSVVLTGTDSPVATVSAKINFAMTERARHTSRIIG